MAVGVMTGFQPAVSPHRVGARAADLDLRRLWNGRPAPNAMGGRALIGWDERRLHLTWSLRCGAAPSMPEGPARFVDRLWEHDVVEIFLASESGSGHYLEVEVGAGGHWLALCFGGVRERLSELREMELHVHNDVRIEAPTWRGSLELPIEALAGCIGAMPWRGLVAASLSGPRVNRESGHERVPLCCPSLPGERPDFHQPAAWARLVG